MFERLRAARQNESGFTLIELLIVIVILGVLASVVVFAVQAFNNDGVTAACQSDKKNVEVATEAFYAKTGAYPGSVAALVPTYLREAPASTKYTVTLGAGGVVTSTGC